MSDPREKFRQKKKKHQQGNGNGHVIPTNNNGGSPNGHSQKNHFDRRDVPDRKRHGPRPYMRQ